MDSFKLSVIVPCFNEEEGILETHKRLTQVLRNFTPNYEILYLDDGSQDRTPELLREMQQRDTQVRVVRLSRNFGHQIAVTAGLDFVCGDAVVIIDADLQDPPEVILEMVQKWREGNEVVYAQRVSRLGESKFKLWSASIFYHLLNLLSEVPIPLNAGDFRLIDRCVVEALRKMPEHHRLLRGMTNWVGYRQVAVPYVRDARFAGTTKYPLRKMVLLALDGIISFSVVPLRVMTLIGFGAFLLSLIGIVYSVLLRLFTDLWVPGWTLMFVGLLFLGGLQLIGLGLLGEYVGRIYGEVKGRPLYLIAERLGFEEASVQLGRGPVPQTTVTRVRSWIEHR